MKRLLLIALIFTMSIMGWVVGYSHHPDPVTIVQYETIEKTVFKFIDREVIVEKPVEVEKVVEVEVEKLVEVPIKLRNFNSLPELEEWIKDKNPLLKEGADCDDYALWLQTIGIRDGYLIPFEVILPAEYNSLFKKVKLPLNSVHTINVTIIGNNIYYVEPQTKEIALGAYLD